MLVPKMLCGDTKTVTAACKRHITRFRRGEPWVEMGMMIDVREAPGLIMLDGPSPLLGGANVRLYAPFRELCNAFISQQTTFDGSLRAFDEALGSTWSTLGLLSQFCYRWLRDSERAERFLVAMMGYWSELDAVGPRYTIGAQHGQGFWELPHLLKYVLSHRGVPQSRLVQPLPDGGIAALLPSKNRGIVAGQ